MKLFVGVMIFIWLFCGLAGSWRLGKLDVDHWKDVLRGPITLLEAFNDNPVSYPEP